MTWYVNIPTVYKHSTVEVRVQKSYMRQQPSNHLMIVFLAFVSSSPVTIASHSLWVFYGMRS